MRKKDLLILIIPAVVLLAAAAVALFFIRRESGYKFTSAAYQSFGNIESVIPEGTSVRLEKETGDLVIDCETAAVEIERELPVYYKNFEQLVIMQDMLCYQPRTGDSGRLDLFSEIYKKNDKSLHVSLGRRDKTVQGGFIYDGKDTYIFLEPVTLSFNQREYELSSFSYIQAVYGSVVCIYDYGTREFICEVPAQEPIVYAGKDYSLDLIYDTLIDHQGKKTILLPNPEQQDSIFDKK